MFRFWTKWRARRRYIRKEEFEAAVADLNANLAAQRAKEKRDFIAALTAEADAIDANIKKELESPEYQKLEGQDKYEADRERREAEKIEQSKRETAKQVEEEAKGGEETAKHFRRQAASSRETADRLRRL